MRRAAPALAALILSCCLGSSTFAQSLYKTGFESPPFTAGASPAGVDGWVNGSGSGAIFTVSTDQASEGVQSLKADNTGSVSFYSVRHDLGGYNSSMGPLEVSVNLWVDQATQPNRIYGLYLGSAATSTLGGTVLGLTIDGAGNVRGGTTWGNTYQNTGLLGTANPADVTGRWLTISLSYDPATGEKAGKISGLGGPTTSYGGNWTGGSAPMNVNIGADYFTTTDRSGIGYFDELSISVIPEPASLALAGIVSLMALRRRH